MGTFLDDLFKYKAKRKGRDFFGKRRERVRLKKRYHDDKNAKRAPSKIPVV
jgi:hypothetical protein